MHSGWCGLLILTITVVAPVLTFPPVKIVGGSNTTIENHPWLVSIWQAEPTPALFCTGFLVSDSLVVTTASCLIYDVSYVRAGSTNCHSGGVTADIEEFIIHPDYDLGTGDSDIAVLRLKTPLAGDNIQSIPLPDKNVSIATGDTFVVAGWGQTDPAEYEISDVLQELEIQAVTTEDCQKTYGTFVTETMICGGGVNGEGPCAGDQGDPVLWNGQPVGLVSFIYHCARAGFPAIFTNVLSFVDWINEVMET